MGGVYDGSFWAWPAASPDPRDGPDKEFGAFFLNVDAVGMKAETKMSLDGGAGA
jgi:hypothetical protein